jgi:hypothetical protein
MWKMVGTYKATLTKVYEMFYPDWANAIGTSVQRCKVIERLEGDIADWHLVVKFPFPLATRDMIVRLKMKMGTDEFWLYGSAVVREDVPPKKNHVRATMKGHFPY